MRKMFRNITINFIRCIASRITSAHIRVQFAAVAAAADIDVIMILEWKINWYTT